MKREIKFRSKKIGSSEWVIGDLLTNNGNPIIVVKADRDYISTTDAVAGKHWHIETPAFYVDTETVGEFTGLKDKNGVEIYEGDLLEHIIDKRFLVWEVQFDNGVFGIVNINGDHRSSFYACDGSKYYFSDRIITGNIYQK